MSFAFNRNVSRAGRIYSRCVLYSNLNRKASRCLSAVTTDITTTTTTTTTTTNSNKQHNSAALQSVKEQGIKILKSTTMQIQEKTKRRLLLSAEDTGPAPEQIKEANRLKVLVEDALEEYTSRHGALFCLQDEPISIIDVEVTPDLRQARVFWSLPFSFLLDDGISQKSQRGQYRMEGQEIRLKVAKRMQIILENKGGVLQGLVHRKMRRYFRPPKIRFVMAEGEMLRSVLKDLL